jgi:hypothetical protein
MFDYLYERLPDSIAQQRPWIERSAEEGGDHG